MEGGGPAHSGIRRLADMIGTGSAGFNFKEVFDSRFPGEMLKYRVGQRASADVAGTDKHDAKRFHAGSIYQLRSGNEQADGLVRIWDILTR
jgi:hypothetical protein